MALICGIDQSSGNTGMALWNPSEPPSTMRLHSFGTDGRTDLEKVQSFSTQMDRILRDWKPDFVAFEQPLQHIQPQVKKIKTLHGVREEQTINAHTALLLNLIAGALIRGLMGRKLPHVMVRPVTWRGSFLGYSTNKKMQAAGHKSWKHAARAQCDRLNIPARNMDQAEAGGIAFWASGCDEWRLINARRAA